MAEGTSSEPKGWPIKDLWEKYEEIAMHFNDLLMKLRTQALAGVAALSVLGGIFAKGERGQAVHWEIAFLLFLVLCIAWAAIWIIDFMYYNRLLLGAVHSIVELERQSKTKKSVAQIDISSIVEKAVASELPVTDRCRAWRMSAGRILFYLLVFVALLFGLCFSGYHWWNMPVGFNAAPAQ